MQIQPDILQSHQISERVDPSSRRGKLEKACKDFEALFLAHMLKTMRQASFTDGKESTPMGLPANNPLQGMFDWSMAQDMSQRSPLGIAEQLMRTLEHSLGSEETDGLSNKNSDPRSGNLKMIVDQVAARHDLDPALIAAVIETESAGNRFAISNKGAKGLMQLMDSTAAELNVDNPFDPHQNIEGGATYLRKMLDRYNGNLETALAAYNAGPTAV
ncbi:transglycosylase SLT domain-containing protein, partial [Calditrichota bacterium]